MDLEKWKKTCRYISIPITLLLVVFVLVFNIPNPMMILIIPVVCFTSFEGYTSGIMSAIVTVVYSAWFFFEKTKDPVASQKLLTIILATSIIVLLIGRLQKEVRNNRLNIERRLVKQAKEINESNSKLIRALATVVEFRDLESGEHISRVRHYTHKFLTLIKDEYNLTDEMIDAISDASVMHDIGKVSIPDHILLKPGKLTDSEYEIMKTHCIKGCEILEALDLSHKDDRNYYYDICRHHHERWDGKGYPDGLKGDEISIWAQVVAVSDVYDALTSNRVYKEAYSHELAVKMILNGECGMFNPLLMKKFELHHLDFKEI